MLLFGDSGNVCPLFDKKLGRVIEDYSTPCTECPFHYFTNESFTCKIIHITLSVSNKQIDEGVFVCGCVLICGIFLSVDSECTNSALRNEIVLKSTFSTPANGTDFTKTRDNVTITTRYHKKFLKFANFKSKL